MLRGIYLLIECIKVPDEFARRQATTRLIRSIQHGRGSITINRPKRLFKVAATQYDPVAAIDF